MELKELEEAVRKIGLALSVTHGCIATDVPEAAEDDSNWRVDHSKEIALLGKLAEHLNIDSGLECGCHSSDPSTTHS